MEEGGNACVSPLGLGGREKAGRAETSSSPLSLLCFVRLFATPLSLKHFACPEIDAFRRTHLVPSFEEVFYNKPEASRKGAFISHPRRALFLR